MGYVQNVTDIDDDILRKAAETGSDWQALGNQWTRHFIRDMQALNIRPPDHFPRATQFVGEIIATVETLLAQGVAYASGGNVYFHIDAWPEYGKLCCLDREEMLAIANQRGNHPDDPHKRDPLDFVLWQAQAPGEPAWPSPWGPGRPGWHIECSSMATELLGETIDIHGGGADLLFPHHESEIAQSEGATGEQPFSRFWIHTAMVRHEGEKMSKSLGNLVMVDQLLERESADTLRLYLNRHQYRRPWSHSDEELAHSRALVDTLRRAVAAPSGSDAAWETTGLTLAFEQAMDDDLDTPAAVAALEQLADDLLAAARAGHDIRAGQAGLRRLSGLLGLRLDRAEPEERVVDGWQRHLSSFLDS